MASKVAATSVELYGRAVGSTPTSRFHELVEGDADAFRLDEACLLIAAHARPGLDVGHYLERLDELAGQFLPPTFDGLLAHLFGPGGFTGNRERYYEPENSMLDRVLERRTGIPITLSVLAMEVGRRSGVPMWGISMPGHFLVRDKVDPAVFADPFHGGRLMTALDCRRLYRSLTGNQDWDDSYLRPVPRRAIVTRVLSNLKTVAAQRNDPGMLLWVMRLRQAIPEVAAEEQAEYARLAARFN
jgi:hypothetical protein